MPVYVYCVCVLLCVYLCVCVYVVLCVHVCVCFVRRGCACASVSPACARTAFASEYFDTAALCVLRRYVRFVFGAARPPPEGGGAAAAAAAGGDGTAAAAAAAVAARMREFPAPPRVVAWCTALWRRRLREIEVWC